MSKNRYEILKRLYGAQGDLSYALAVFGDTIAKREKYKSSDLNGIEAVYFYLIHKFGWLPRDVRSMSFEDIRFVLSEELNGWTLPKDARGIK